MDLGGEAELRDRPWVTPVGAGEASGGFLLLLTQTLSSDGLQKRLPLVSPQGDGWSWRAADPSKLTWELPCGQEGGEGVGTWENTEFKKKKS